MADPVGHLSINVAENWGLGFLHALLYINKSLYMTKYHKCAQQPEPTSFLSPKGHGFIIGYPKGRNVERALGFSLTGTVSTSPNLAKEGARSATIITRPSGSRFS